MLVGVIAVLAWAYVHKLHGHVRVDVLYMRLPPRGKALTDVLGALIFFFPLVGVLIFIAIDKMLFSWELQEKLSMSYWYPPAYPIRTVMVIGLLLFALQGSVQFWRDVYLLIKGKEYD
jgi:TRAP-type mannitol/chloroaromatic compound transport system permease small subunit